MPIITYKCAKCGKEYETLSFAEYCEKSHAEIVDTAYVYSEKDFIYPTSITLKMARGVQLKEVEYVRKSSEEEGNDRKLWYIGRINGEGNKAFVVELTKAEYKAVDKFLNHNTRVIDESHSSNCFIEEKGYETEEEAKAVILYK